MRKALIIIVVVVVLLLLALVLPVFPFSQSNSSLLGSTKSSFTAQVSLTFDLFHCGYVLNPTSTTNFLGYQVGQSIAPTGFYCVIVSTPSSG
jgi:flagellar basal body-associated protein FliL